MEPLGMLIIRLTFGVIFALHGMHQFFGWFGGGSMRDVMKRLELRPYGFWASLSGLGNLTGGVMFSLGALTFLGALIITVMVVAMMTIKKRSGFWDIFLFCFTPLSQCRCTGTL